MDYKEQIRQAALGGAFVGLTLTGIAGKRAPKWVRVRVRPVEIKGERLLQFSYFDEKKDVTKNFALADAAARIDEALAEPFSHVELQSAAGDLHVRVTRKGKALVSEGKPSSAGPASLAHDRAKRRLLADDDPIWGALGLAGKDGRVLPSSRGKFTQVNEFLRLLDEALDETQIPRANLTILDAGCGNAYLTFAAARHLSGAQIIGVDTNAELIGRCSALAEKLGRTQMEFRVSTIADAAVEPPPHVVMSLHACDTATDEALARGVAWKARVILAAPCCQQELHHAIESDAFAGLLRHGLLRERLADVLTDAFRALALSVMGYRVAACQFVEPEATAKNLLLRAVLARAPGDAQAVRDYIALKNFWKVEPAIERMLGESFRKLVMPR